MSQVSRDYNSIPWNEIFTYDSSAHPSCLRWKKDVRGGKNGVFLKAKKGDIAGSIHRRKNSEYITITVPHGRVNWHSGRVVWILHNGYLPKNLVIDHVDGDTTNNRIENLRAISQSENNRNASIRKDNASGIPGVSFSYCSKTGKPSVVSKWIEGGKRCSKSFSIQKYGLLPAIAMAISTRSERMNHLNEIGYGYTDRHLQKEKRV